MSEVKLCTRCGAALPAGDEPCPRCLIALGRAQQESDSEGESRVTTGSAKRRPTAPLEDIAARFPELEVLALVGEGGMGAVYKARQANIDRLVALKVLAFDPIDHPSFAERFRREARVLARLDHPNVVKLFDFGERDGLFFLLLEFVDGTNLRALLREGLLEPRQALAIVPQICEALQFAHDEGVVHRDIKPENVLIDAKGRVKIADFGLAKLVHADLRDASLTEVGQVMGTPAYMAPEQLRGDAGVDHRADIFSLGVVFYEMLTGNLPRGNFELPSKTIRVDVKLDEIVLKALELTPELRYQHAIEVKTDVEGVGGRTAGRRPEAAARAPLEIGAKPHRRWRYFLAFVGLWPIVGWGFNAGLEWFVVATAILAAALWSFVRVEIDAEPEPARSRRSRSRTAVAARRIAAILLLTLSFCALALGHIAVFDRFASNYRPGPGDPESLRALESELLPELESRRSLAWPVAREHLEFAQEFSAASDSERLYHQPWLLALSLAACLAAIAALGSRRVDLSTWRGWHVPARAAGSLFGSLLLVHAACILFGSLRGDAGTRIKVLEPGAALGDREGTRELARRLRIALIEREYRVTAEAAWSYREIGAPDPDRELQIYFADPVSPLARWRLSWTGPRRVRPHAVFIMRGPRAGGDATLECDLGDAPADSLERRIWSEWFMDLLPGPR
jgi:serine/threonine protein kinase